MRVFFADLGDELFSLDRGLPWTFLRLSFNPGRNIRHYIEWRDPRLAKPLRYLLVCLALAAIALHLSGFDTQALAGIEEGFTDTTSDGVGEGVHALIVALSRLDLILPLAWLPATAMAVHRVYGDARINLAEAFVLGMYVLAQLSLVMAVLFVTVPHFVGPSAIGLLLVFLPPIYFAWVCAGYFDTERRRVLRATLASLTAFLALWVLVIAFVIAVVVVQPWWQGVA